MTTPKSWSRSWRRSFTVLLLALAGLGSAATALAQPKPTSDLLLPYFEVDLTGFKLTTLFTVTNSSEEPVPIRMVVHTNWGIEMEEVLVTLEPHETRGFNLRDWLLLGELPQADGMLASLAPRRLSHVQSALMGQRSPEDQLYYGTQVFPDLAVGYVTIRAQGAHRDDVLWGNYYIIDPEGDAAQGDILVDIDPTHECQGLCNLHSLFFLEGAVFDGGTEVIVWNPNQGTPSATAEPAAQLAGVRTLARNLQGEVIFEGGEGLLATQTLTLEEMAVIASAGSLELSTVSGPDDQPVDSFIAIRYRAENRYSATLQAWCQPARVDIHGNPKPSIDLEKLTNGVNADAPTGPRIPVGDAVLWEYVVRNTGNVTLTDIVVTDDRGVDVSCPESELGPGRSMTCTGHGVAVTGQYANVGTVTGIDPEDTTVSDSDPSHYFGVEDEPTAEIDLEKATNGHDADSGPGPELTLGSPVTWTYVVTNVGEVELLDLQVTDDKEGAIDCPRTSLTPGESMTCTASGTAGEGQYANLGTVTGRTDGGTEVEDRDPSHYFGVSEPPPAQGCTPGYWKNHSDSWAAAGFSTGQSVESVFGQAGAYPALGVASLIEALDFNGGPGLEGAARNLLRAAVAGLLDASHPDVDYPRTPGQVVSEVNAALASGDRDTMLSVAASIDQDNNLGCPLS